MTQYVDVNIDNNIELGDLKACLDYPTCGYHEGEYILIAGWVLPPEPLNNNIKIIIRLKENQQYQDIDTIQVKRPDVLKALLPGMSFPESAMHVGFSARIAFKKSSTATVIIVREGREFPWYNINIVVEDSLTSFVGQIHSTTKKNIEAPFVSNVTTNVKVYYPHTFENSHYSVVHTHLKKIFKAVKSDEFIVELYKSQNGHVECTNSALNFIVCTSMPAGHNLFLFCRDETGLEFIIHQHVTSIDGVYYPSKGVYYSFCHGSQNTLATLVEVLLRDINYFNKKQYKDTAFLIGHGRPYHFMYDGMLGLETIYQNINGISDQTQFYTLESNAFIDAPKIYNQTQNTKFVDNKTLIKLEQEGMLFIKIGAHFGNGAKNPIIAKKISCLDERIVNYVMSANDCNITNNLKKHFPIIWLGVTGQKRAWLEQTEGYASLINKLYKSFPGIAIIFDGWTSSLVSIPRDKTESENDQAIIREIKNRIPSDITIVDLVGSTIDKKIHIGSVVDCAVVNYSTGSMNISRICGRPCITHMNNSFSPARDDHIHKNAFHISEEFVTDVIENDCGIDSTNYHLDWENIYNAMLLHFEKYNFFEKRW